MDPKVLLDRQRKVESLLRFYFSEENLAQDRWLRRKLRDSGDRSILVSEIHSFNKIRDLEISFEEFVDLIGNRCSDFLGLSSLCNAACSSNTIGVQFLSDLPGRAEREEHSSKTFYVEFCGSAVDGDGKILPSLSVLEDLPLFKLLCDRMRTRFDEAGAAECENLSLPVRLARLPHLAFSKQPLAISVIISACIFDMDMIGKVFSVELCYCSIPRFSRDETLRLQKLAGFSDVIGFPDRLPKGFAFVEVTNQRDVERLRGDAPQGFRCWLKPEWERLKQEYLMLVDPNGSHSPQTARSLFHSKGCVVKARGVERLKVSQIKDYFAAVAPVAHCDYRRASRECFVRFWEPWGAQRCCVVFKRMKQCIGGSSPIQIEVLSGMAERRYLEYAGDMLTKFNRSKIGSIEDQSVSSSKAVPLEPQPQPQGVRTVFEESDGDEKGESGGETAEVPRHKKRRRKSIGDGKRRKTVEK